MEDLYLPGDQNERILTGGETALKVWREYLGRDLADVAAAAGLTPEVLRGMEDRSLPLDEDSRDKLAAALGVRPTWIEREVYE